MDPGPWGMERQQRDVGFRGAWGGRDWQLGQKEGIGQDSWREELGGDSKGSQGNRHLSL